MAISSRQQRGIGAPFCRLLAKNAAQFALRELIVEMQNI